MRTEVKRSLLLWPIAASVTITALAWLPGISGPSAPLLKYAGAQAESRLLDAVTLYAKSRLRRSESELSARSEHGTRAMTMPTRVAEAFGVESTTLAAPVRDEQQELAGLVLESDAAEPEEMSLALSGPMHPGTLDTLRNRNHLPVRRQQPSQCTPPSFVGPRLPETPPIESVLSEIAAERLSLIPQSIQALGKRIFAAPQPTSPSTEPVQPPVDAPTIRPEVEKPTEIQRSVTTDSPAGWPVTRQLDRQLLALADVTRPGEAREQFVSSSRPADSVQQWSQDVSLRLEELRSLPRLGDPQAGVLIDELSKIAAEGSQRAERLTDRRKQIEWLRAVYAVTRRVAVWRPVWEVSRHVEPTWMVSDDQIVTPQTILDTIESVRSDLQATGDVQGWDRYLLLEEIAAATEAREVQQRTLLAQRFLSRLSWHGLDPEHVRWLQRDSVSTLASMIRPWTREAVDYANLLRQLERQESNSIDLAAVDIAGAVQSLRFAENPKAAEIAEAIDTHYRNANVRLALSEAMLQRILPAMDPQSIPIRTSMLGSRVRGVSRVESDLRIHLTPSSDRWNLKLNTVGNIRTQSTGFKGPVAVRTSGKSSFVAATPIEVTAQGLKVGGSRVDVSGRTRLRSIRTDYDGWPLIGTLVQGIAASRYESVAPRSNQAANRKIRHQVGQEIDSQLDRRLDAATIQLSEMVLGPLGTLKLDPKVTDMQTTESRLLARYRLAGDWQLGAFTPRPRAPGTSLMSLQVHQSALNNTLEQLIPRERPMSIRDMIQTCAETFGQENISIPDDIPEDVSVKFASTRPITVEIEEGELWVTLRIVNLRRGERVELTRFIVRANYRPQLDGMQAVLVRNGHLRISGPGMSMRQRLPVRAIFNKVLSPNRPLAVTLPPMVEHPATEGLVVSQLELRGGWLGMAISEAEAPRIALIQPPERKSRSAKR